MSLDNSGHIAVIHECPREAVAFKCYWLCCCSERNTYLNSPAELLSHSIEAYV